MKKVISCPNAPAAVGPYCHAQLCDNTLYVSGQLGLVPATGELPEGIEAQTKQSLANMAAILETAGMTMADVVKTTVLLANIADFGVVNGIYAEAFGDSVPARSCFQVAALPKAALVEIECIAVKG